MKKYPKEYEEYLERVIVDRKKDVERWKIEISELEKQIANKQWLIDFHTRNAIEDEKELKELRENDLFDK